MLVLSRTRDETIMIGDDIRITIVDVRGDKVRVGVSAPRHIKVHRQEVYDAIQRENREAACMDAAVIHNVMGTVSGAPGIASPRAKARR